MLHINLFQPFPFRPGRRSGNGQHADLRGRRGAGAQRAVGRRRAARAPGRILSGGCAVGHLAKQMEGRTPGIDLRRPPAGGRRDRRLRAVRGDAPLFPPQGAAARLAAAAAGAGRHPGLHHAGREAGRVQQRAPRRRRPGLGHARGQGRRHRRRACPLPSRWPAWSATSAAAPPKWP